VGLPLWYEGLLPGMGGTPEYWPWSGQKQLGAWKPELRHMPLSAVERIGGVVGSVAYGSGYDRNAQLS